MEEKKVNSITKKRQQEKDKELTDQQNLHKVISHEEIKKKEKPTKNLASSHGDVKNMAQPCASNISNDYLNSSFGKKLKRIAPHPGPSLVNHNAFPGVLFKETNLAASNANSHLSKLRRILPAPQRSSTLPTSPANSPRKMLEHLTQQTKHIPTILSTAYNADKSLLAARTQQKPVTKCTPTSALTTAHAKNKKTPSAAKRTVSLDEGIPQTVRQLNCDHEVVAKTAGAELSNSPVKDKSNKSWLLYQRNKESGLRGEELNLQFVITSDEGIRIEADTCEGMWIIKQFSK